MERRRTATATGLYDSFCHIYFFLHSFSLHLFVSQKSFNDEELYRQKYRKLLHFEINILNILNNFTEIIGMAPPINVQDWYGDRHTCQIASGALALFVVPGYLTLKALRHGSQVLPAITPMPAFTS